MRRTFLVALLVILFGATITYRVWLRSSYLSDNRIPPAVLHKEVTLHFLECAGKRAVFVLQNGTDHRIYAMVHPADYWEEFKHAKLQYGLHLIEYKASGQTATKNVGPTFDAVELFRPIVSNETVRYGVNLGADPGEYTMKIPYMDDEELARRLNEDWPTMLKTEFERVKASWRYVSSPVVTTTCQ
jgi:hypothetical protein